MRRCASLAVVAVAGVLAVTGTAIAARTIVFVGGYHGRTELGKPVHFRVTANRRVVHFRWSGIRLTCTDGDSFVGSAHDSGSFQGHVFAPHITRRGHFGFFITFRGGRFDVNGTIRRRSAHGTIRERTRFDTQNHLDPNGPVHCDSGSVRFTAHT